MTSYDYLYKIIICGDSAVGKTSFLERYTYDTFHEYIASTIGVDFFSKILPIKDTDYNAKLQLWDTSGCSDYHTITKAYFRGIDGGIIVFDLSNRESFNHVKGWLQKIFDHCPDNDVQLILVGNKCDLPEEVLADEVKELVDEYDNNICTYMPSSAKDNFNVNEIISYFATHIYTHNIDNGKEMKGKKDTQHRNLVDVEGRHVGKPFYSCCFIS
jgi:small GTP-binding protein